MEMKIYKYIYKNFINYILQLLFQEEFKGFTIKDFKKIYFIIKVKLRTYLLQRGVYVATYNNRYPLYKVLYNIFIKKKQHKWINKELITALIEAKLIIIITLQEQLNPKLDILAVILHTPKSAQPTATILSGTQTPISIPLPQQFIPQ